MASLEQKSAYLQLCAESGRNINLAHCDGPMWNVYELGRFWMERIRKDR